MKYEMLSENTKNLSECNTNSRSLFWLMLPPHLFPITLCSMKKWDAMTKYHISNGKSRKIIWVSFLSKHLRSIERFMHEF